MLVNRKGRRVTDDILLFQPAFLFHDGHGLPLAEIVQTVRDHGMEVDWIAFYEDAKAAGWSKKKIWQTIEKAKKDASRKTK
jgi:alanyl-tRNA synthetase